MSTSQPNPDSDPGYFKWLSEWAQVHSDGCTGVKDIYVHCCWQHDYCYQTGNDPREAYKGQVVPISREEADALFKSCMQAESSLGRFSPISWIRYGVVRIFGRFFYTAH